MTVPYMEDALWLKARLFINLAMDSDNNRTFDEQALWASLSLELLAKSALARVSPLLIATPNEEGTNLLIASGLVEGTAMFHSVPANTVFTRCAKAFRPFSLREAKLIASGRNEYLHGGNASLTVLPSQVWWPRFWAQAVILLAAQDKAIDEFVGADRKAVVDRYLTQNRKHVENLVTALIGSARQRLALHRAGQMTARAAAEWNAGEVHAGLSHSADATCPSCGSTGRLEGDDVISAELRHEQTDFGDYDAWDDYDAWVDLTIAADYFACRTCRLVLDRYEFIETAGIATDFSDIGNPVDHYEPDYGND